MSKHPRLPCIYLHHLSSSLSIDIKASFFFFLCGFWCTFRLQYQMVICWRRAWNPSLSKLTERHSNFCRLQPSVQDWLPEGYVARFVVEIEEQLNLRSLKASYVGRGSQPYNPVMLLALLFYGYSTGVFSSRKLERSTYDSVAFRFTAPSSHPDHNTIATFRKRFLKELSGLFVQILMIAR